MAYVITSDEAVAVAGHAYNYRAVRVKFLHGARNRILFATQGRSYKSAEALCSHLCRLFAAEEMAPWWFSHLYADWRPWAQT